MVVGSSNNFLLTLQDILNPDLSFSFGKMQVIKKIFQIFAFLIIGAGLDVHFKGYSELLTKKQTQFACWRPLM